MAYGDGVSEVSQVGKDQEDQRDDDEPRAGYPERPGEPEGRDRKTAQYLTDREYCEAPELVDPEVPSLHLVGDYDLHGREPSRGGKAQEQPEQEDRGIGYQRNRYQYKDYQLEPVTDG